MHRIRSQISTVRTPAHCERLTIASTVPIATGSSSQINACESTFLHFLAHHARAYPPWSPHLRPISSQADSQYTRQLSADTSSLIRSDLQRTGRKCCDAGDLKARLPFTPVKTEERVFVDIDLHPAVLHALTWGWPLRSSAISDATVQVRPPPTSTILLS